MVNIGYDDEFDYLDEEDDSNAVEEFAPKIKGSSKPSLVPEEEVNTEPAEELKEKEKEIEEEAKVEEKPAREFESQIYIVKVTTNKEDKALETIADKVKKKNIDIYHSLSGCVPRKAKFKTVMTVHDLAYYYYPHFPTPSTVRIAASLKGDG